MTTLEFILAFVTAASGLGNIAQFVNLRAMKNKASYEADGVHVDVLNKTIIMQADEIKRLQDRVRELEEKQALRDKEYEERERILEERIRQIENKC